MMEPLNRNAGTLHGFPKGEKWKPAKGQGERRAAMSSRRMEGTDCTRGIESLSGTKNRRITATLGVEKKTKEASLRGGTLENHLWTVKQSRRKLGSKRWGVGTGDWGLSVEALGEGRAESRGTEDQMPSLESVNQPHARSGEKLSLISRNQCDLRTGDPLLLNAIEGGGKKSRGGCSASLPCGFLHGGCDPKKKKGSGKETGEAGSF